MRGLYRAWLLIISLLLAVRVDAGEITDFVLESEGDGYRLQAQALIAAPMDRVWTVLTNYADLYKVSPRIIESELVTISADGVARVRTVNSFCFLLFCRDLRHVQLIRELGYGDFESESVSGESDLSYGYARWRLHNRGDNTGLNIDFIFAMDSYSWIPSFLTRFIARSALKEDAAVLIRGIERAVHTREGKLN